MFGPALVQDTSKIGIGHDILATRLYRFFRKKVSENFQKVL